MRRCVGLRQQRWVVARTAAISSVYAFHRSDILGAIGAMHGLNAQQEREMAAGLEANGSSSPIHRFRPSSFCEPAFDPAYTAPNNQFKVGPDHFSAEALWG